MPEEDCEVCGATAFIKCPKCGMWLCSICVQNPCDNEHFLEDDEEDREPDIEEDSLGHYF